MSALGWSGRLPQGLLALQLQSWRAAGTGSMRPIVFLHRFLAACFGVELADLFGHRAQRLNQTYRSVSFAAPRLRRPPPSARPRLMPFCPSGLAASGGRRRSTRVGRFASRRARPRTPCSDARAPPLSAASQPTSKRSGETLFAWRDRARPRRSPAPLAHFGISPSRRVSRCTDRSSGPAGLCPGRSG